MCLTASVLVVFPIAELGQHVVLEPALVVRPIEATLPPLGDPVGDERAGDVARISFRPP
jgi:hypothetical protein